MELTESEGKKGCLLANLIQPDAAKIVAWCDANIPVEDLAEDGFEREIHVTVAYGFEDDAETVEDLEAILSETPPIAITLGSVSRFENDADVLKIDVESPDLQALHYLLREIFGKRLEVTYPDYHPHLTLAYVKKDACRDLDGHDRFNGNTYVFDSLTYSAPGSSKKHQIDLRTK